MQMRTRARYSLRMMLAIARLSTRGDPVGLRDVSMHCGVSRRYLEQLVGPLRNASLVRSVSGRGGGYSLARNSDEIKIGDIFEAAIGPIAVTECAVRPETCIHHQYCNCVALYRLINHRINQVLDKYTLADLMDRHGSGKILEEINGPEQKKRQAAR